MWNIKRLVKSSNFWYTLPLDKLRKITIEFSYLLVNFYTELIIQFATSESRTGTGSCVKIVESRPES